jgi:hypothetical protein
MKRVAFDRFARNVQSFDRRSRKSRDGKTLRAGDVLPLACLPHRRTEITAMFSNRKTECPISRQDFVSQAKSVEVTINGQPTLAMVKEFSTGSFGWHHGDKLTIKVGDTLVKVQVGLTLTVIGSKDAPKDAPTAVPAAA